MNRSSAIKAWAAVRVERGFAAEVRLFPTERGAFGQVKKWAKQMNPDYDDTNIFPVSWPSRQQVC